MSSVRFRAPRAALDAAKRSVAVGAVVLSSCIGYEADPLLPAVELADLIDREVADIPAPVTSFAGAEMWFPFAAEIDVTDGLQLSEANSLAMFYAPRLVTQRMSQRVAAAQLLQAGLLPNPRLFVSPKWSTQGTGFLMPTWLAFQIPLGGQLDAEEAAAQGKLDSAAWRVMQTELQVLEDVRVRFVGLTAQRRERAVLQQLLVEAERIVDWVERLAGAGEVGSLNVQLARLERDDLIWSIQEQDQEMARATTELLVAIGLHPAAAIQPVTPAALLASPDLPAADPQAVLRHPALRAQEATYREAEGALRLEIARQYPTITFGPDFEYDRGDTLLGFGLGVPLNVFDQNRGQVVEALERRTLARETYRARLLALASTEAAARRERELALEQLDFQRTGPLLGAAAAEQALAARLRTGYADVLEVLTSRRAISRARVREVELQRRIAEATLRAAVAGGFVIGEDPEQHGSGATSESEATEKER